MIKVYMVTGNHPIYKDVVETAPKEVQYLNTQTTTRSYNKTLRGEIIRAYYTLKSGINFGDHPTRINKVWLTQLNKDCDMYYSAGVILYDKKPWILQLEHIAGLVSNNNINNPRYRKVLRKLIQRKYCTHLMPMSNFAGKTFSNVFGNEFENKSETIYPAMKSTKLIQKKKNDEKVKFLFIGSRGKLLTFEMKGGGALVNAFNELSKKYDAELTIISQSMSEKTLKKIRKNKKIKLIYDSVPRQTLLEKYFPEHDVFVFLSFQDTFGYVCLEAKNAGLPIITSDNGALPEIVTHKKSGLVVKTNLNSRFVAIGPYKPKEWAEFQNFMKQDDKSIEKDLYKKMEYMINNSTQRRKMAYNSRREVETGKFSANYRNKKLLKVYKESIQTV